MEKSVEISHTLFEYFFSVVIASLPYKERNVFVGFQSFSFSLNGKFVQVPSGAINIKIYGTPTHPPTPTHTHTHIQDWFLSPKFI